MKEYSEIAREFHDNNGNSFLTGEQVLRVMEIERLERIASVLEDINSTLISMSAPVGMRRICAATTLSETGI